MKPESSIKAPKIDFLFSGAIFAIFLQAIATYIFITNNTHFVADDLRAFIEARSSDLLTYITIPIDVHRVPLHRAVNFFISSLWPMNFYAAATFLITCHVLSLLFLYGTLQLISPGRANIVLILVYALNPYVLNAMFWWSAGLHRFPYILLTTISCFTFCLYGKTGKIRQAATSIGCAILATGFYAKGVLIPCYWLAILFCTIEFRRTSMHSNELRLIGLGLLLSTTYTMWYLITTPGYQTFSGNRGEVLLSCMHLFWSVIAQAPIPIRFEASISTYINFAWLLLFSAALTMSRYTWRPILAGIGVISLNVLVIASSPRASFLGALTALIPHYHAELIFLLIPFFSLAIHHFNGRSHQKIFHKRQQSRILIPCIFLGSYAALSWHAIYANIQPDENSKQRRSAKFAKKLATDIALLGEKNLNLLNRAMPPHFSFGGLIPRILPLSDYLALWGKYPEFNNTNGPLRWVDIDGHIRSLKVSDEIPFVSEKAPFQSQQCLNTNSSETSLNYIPTATMRGDRALLSIHYSAATDVSIDAHLKSHNTAFLPIEIHMPAEGSEQIADISLAGIFSSFSLNSVTLTSAVGPICILKVILKKHD